MASGGIEPGVIIKIEGLVREGNEWRKSSAYYSRRMSSTPWPNKFWNPGYLDI